MKTEQPNLSCLKDLPNPEYFLLPTLSSQYEQICSAQLYSHLDTQAEAQTQASMDPCSILLYCCVCESIYVMASTGRPQDNYEKLFLSSYLYQVLESKLRSSGWTAAPLPSSGLTGLYYLSFSSFFFLGGGEGVFSFLSLLFFEKGPCWPGLELIVD